VCLRGVTTQGEGWLALVVEYPPWPAAMEAEQAQGGAQPQGVEVRQQRGQGCQEVEYLWVCVVAQVPARWDCLGQVGFGLAAVLVEALAGQLVEGQEV
jgi:hypothetical protein